MKKMQCPRCKERYAGEPSQQLICKYCDTPLQPIPPASECGPDKIPLWELIAAAALIAIGIWIVKSLKGH